MRDCFEDMEFSVCERMMNVNCTSHIAVTKAVLPQMMERKSGMIVNISSMSGLVPVPVRTMYSCSKFGLSGFGKSLRAEVKSFGIDVIQIYPSYISTNISSNAMTGTGERFAKKDSNIASGIPVSDCAN